MPTEPGWTSAYITNETKQRYINFQLVGERIEQTFRRIVETSEIIRSNSLPKENVLQTARRLIDFQQKIVELFQPLQEPNETILDAINRLAQKKQKPIDTQENLKPFTQTRTVI